MIPKDLLQVLKKEIIDYDQTIESSLVNDIDYILRAIINKHAEQNAAYQSAYGRYQASTADTPIFSRDMPDFMKINNQINNSFMSEIIDTKQGYMAGIPITYTVKPIDIPIKDYLKTTKVESYVDITNKVRRFGLENDLVDLNMETVKMSSVCGTSARLMYINLEGKPEVVNVDPWETIFIYKDLSKTLACAIRYYYQKVATTKTNGRNKKLTTEVESRLAIDIYDNTYIYQFIADESGLLSPTTFVEKNPRKHMFKTVPLFEYRNNNERQGDCAKIYTLIDTYDKVLSDLSSEMEQFRLAYIALYGLKATKADMDKLRQTGMFEMTRDGKVEFITKKVDIDSIMSLLDKLETNIIRFSKSVNFKDENFYGNLSGVAIKYKLTQLEEKCKVLEVKFDSADTYMWKTLSTFWAIKNITLDPYEVHRQWTRNIPINMLEEARIQTELKGNVSTKTRMSVASFIPDADIEHDAYIRELKENEETGINTMGKENKTVAPMKDLEDGAVDDDKTTNSPESKKRTARAKEKRSTE
jgi:SPP1 family phage portal protein